MTCAWIDTSSADTGSSHDDELRLDRQRAGDADALALPAGELVRVAVDEARVQADQRQQLLHPRAHRLPPSPQVVDLDRLGDDVADRHARVERGVRVLEDHLHVAAHLAHLARR